MAAETAQISVRLGCVAWRAVRGGSGAATCLRRPGASVTAGVVAIGWTAASGSWPLHCVGTRAGHQRARTGHTVEYGRLTTAALVRVSARIISGSVRTAFCAGVGWDGPGRTRQAFGGGC